MTVAISYGDAVGNEIMDIDRMLRKRGIDTEIRVINISKHMRLYPRVKKLNDTVHPKPDDTILYHVTSGAELNMKVYEYGCKVIVRYHNITPPEFFEGYNEDLKKHCAWGREQLREMAGKTEYAIADSEFNKQDLISCGFSCPIDVVPILKRPIKTGRVSPDLHTVLTVGRLAPNKRVDNVIKIFARYQEKYDPQAKLVIVGSDYALQKCSGELKELCDILWTGDKAGMKPPIFAGHVGNMKLAGYFRKAGLYITMSEHEGFCVPLVESMEYGIPIVAGDSTAIPGTLGGSGVLLKDKDPDNAAAIMHRLMTDMKYRNEIIEGERRRAKDFAYEKVGEEMMGVLI